VSCWNDSKPYGLTQRKLAELLDWQEAKISDLVQGKGGVSEVITSLWP
jgi:plasmid maintenance system antidote protein VapI